MSNARPILGYEGRYSITNDGKIYSSYKRNTFDGLRKQHTDKNGYKRVTLFGNGTSKNRLVHQLVAQAFIGENKDNLFVCHKDGDKENNHVDNLYYGTRSDNSNDAVRHGTHNFIQDGFDKVRVKGEDCAWSKLDEDKVRYIKKMKGVKTCRELGQELNVSYANISAIWCGKSWRNIQ